MSSCRGRWGGVCRGKKQILARGEWALSVSLLWRWGLRSVAGPAPRPPAWPVCGWHPWWALPSQGSCRWVERAAGWASAGAAADTRGCCGQGLPVAGPTHPRHLPLPAQRSIYWSARSPAFQRELWSDLCCHPNSSQCRLKCGTEHRRPTSTFPRCLWRWRAPQRNDPSGWCLPWPCWNCQRGSAGMRLVCCHWRRRAADWGFWRLQRRARRTLRRGCRGSHWPGCLRGQGRRWEDGGPNDWLGVTLPSEQSEESALGFSFSFLGYETTQAQSIRKHTACRYTQRISSPRNHNSVISLFILKGTKYRN